KMLVFEQKKISRATIKEALAANWQGYDNVRELCLAAPKFGNGLSYVDSIAADLYRFWADTAHTFTSAWGGRVKCSGISITSYGPGGELTGATPDGRLAGENLADGTVSAAQGLDVRGPTALVRSGMSIEQTPYQSTLFNLKFHPSAMKSREDLRKVSQLVKTYFAEGGKHVQFNVVDKSTLLDAQAHPEKHRNLIVRIAGYSAYFVQLTRKIQNDIIGRTELNAH
ncbi:MAG: formate acetyltransferase, partial [Rhodocyclaceae bacterium]